MAVLNEQEIIHQSESMHSEFTDYVLSRFRNFDDSFFNKLIDISETLDFLEEKQVKLPHFFEEPSISTLNFRDCIKNKHFFLEEEEFSLTLDFKNRLIKIDPNFGSFPNGISIDFKTSDKPIISGLENFGIDDLIHIEDSLMCFDFFEPFFYPVEFFEKCVYSIGHPDFSIKDGCLLQYFGHDENVIIPDIVKSIGEGAFKGCSGLTSVIIPCSVTSIGDHAFCDCSGLPSINIPNSVTSIGNQAFYNCSGLTSIEIPNSVTSIGNHAFYNCKELTSIEIPNSVINIGFGAFCACHGLTSINIPNSVTSIGKCAFEDCSGLTSVIIPDSVVKIDNFVFSHCSGLKSVTIPDSVTSIGDYVFKGCSSLKEVKVPFDCVVDDKAFDEHVKIVRDVKFKQEESSSLKEKQEVKQKNSI